MKNYENFADIIDRVIYEDGKIENFRLEMIARYFVAPGWSVGPGEYFERNAELTKEAEAEGLDLNGAIISALGEMIIDARDFWLDIMKDDAGYIEKTGGKMNRPEDGLDLDCYFYVNGRKFTASGIIGGLDGFTGEEEETRDLVNVETVQHW